MTFEIQIIKELGIVGAGAVGMFFIFKNQMQEQQRQMQETQKQNNDVVGHLMETNKQMHDSIVVMSNDFNITVGEHTKAIHELREEIKKMNEK